MPLKKNKLHANLHSEDQLRQAEGKKVTTFGIQRKPYEKPKITTFTFKDLTKRALTKKPK